MAAALAFDDAVAAFFQPEVKKWGEGQLRASDRALATSPDFPAARFAAAMVFTARQRFSAAIVAASAGAAAQSRQTTPDGAPFPSIGLHWLRGLLLLREQQIGLAVESFAREIDELRDAHVYAGEFRVNAQVAAGFAHLAARDATGAVDVFRMALEGVPRNARALVGLYTALQTTSLAAEAHLLLPQIHQIASELATARRTGESALIRAAAQALQGRLDEGCATLEQLLEEAPPGHAGWQIPIDPALTPLRGHERFPRVLSLLAARAA
jgi:tetratricopeptide (TPR) repeat protein